MHTQFMLSHIPLEQAEWPNSEHCHWWLFLVAGYGWSLDMYTYNTLPEDAQKCCKIHQKNKEKKKHTLTKALHVFLYFIIL